MSDDSISERPVNLGIVGVGHRGESLLQRCITMEDVTINAVCDVQDRRRGVANRILADADRPSPQEYTDADTMFAATDLDGVLITTPWRFHIPIAIQAMNAGVRPGMDVGPASTLAECWQLVHTAESTGMHCMLLENSCFRRETLAALRMVRAGLFGDLVHGECGYCHDLRPRLNAVPGTSRGRTAERIDGHRYYRSIHHEQRTGDLYPTHGVGPMANCLAINRGNRFVSLTSTTSAARGLSAWAERNLPADHPSHDIDWRHGDIVTTVLTCANGETLSVTHDVSLPRPDNSKRYVLRGTRGIWQAERDAIYIDERSPDHEWEAFDPYLSEFEHPLWAAYRKDGIQGGHGGSDYLVVRAFVQSIAQQCRPPIDVYDAATWMAIAPLSAESIARGSDAVAFPDFTTGDWMSRAHEFGWTDPTGPEALAFDQ